MIKQLNSFEVRTPRLQIRRVTASDLTQIYAIHRIPEVNQYLPYDTWLDWEDAESWFATIEQRQQDNDAAQFVLEVSESHIIAGNNIVGTRNIVGTCIVFNQNPAQGSLELGYVLDKRTWKQGYMLEALSSFIPALQQALGLRCINAKVDQGNTASLSLLKKLDFQHVDAKTEDDGVTLLILSKQLFD